MEVTLRPARIDDVIAIGRLHHRSRRSAYHGIVSPGALDAVSADATAEWWVERWSYERDTHRLTVAECQRELTGFTYLGPHEGGDRLTGELYAIHIEPSRRGHGIGTLLLGDAVDAMRAAGRHRGVLWVYRANRSARRFYEHNGWQPDGIERDAWLGPDPVTQLRYGRGL
ncbi:GNAT family N-acetyltransferase [Solwaraspora sp. WMMB335]|uniref:GNAT family N-acetyltransferase n=1 Tax=Solwaraspora sp. WMMB335 TaxID=3404118 RepID=UPI003B933799